MTPTLFPLQYQRQQALPVDVDQSFATTSARNAYLTSPRRYAGMIVYDAQQDATYVLNGATSAWSLIATGTINNNLSGLNDVSLSAPASNQFLKYNGTAWYNSSIQTTDIPSLDMSKITTGNLVWSRISSTPTTLSGYGISSSDTLFDGKYFSYGTIRSSANVLLNSADFFSVNATGNPTTSQAYLGFTNTYNISGTQIGMQLFLNAPSDDGLYYRRYDNNSSSWGTWYQAASRTWVNSQGYLTSSYTGFDSRYVTVGSGLATQIIFSPKEFGNTVTFDGDAYLNVYTEFNGSVNINAQVNAYGDFYFSGYVEVEGTSNFANVVTFGDAAIFQSGVDVTASVGSNKLVVTNSGGYLAGTSGTGFVKMSGGVISYDNSTYLTTSTASSTYQPLENQRLSTTNSPTFAGLTSGDLVIGSRATPFVYLSGINIGTAQCIFINQNSLKIGWGTDTYRSGIESLGGGNGDMIIRTYNANIYLRDQNDATAKIVQGIWNGTAITDTYIASVNYSKLTGAPTALSQFTNDVGYITGSYTGFDSRYQPLENQRLSTSNSPTFAGVTLTGSLAGTSASFSTTANNFSLESTGTSSGEISRVQLYQNSGSSDTRSGVIEWYKGGSFSGDLRLLASGGIDVHNPSDQSIFNINASGVANFKTSLAAPDIVAGNSFIGNLNNTLTLGTDLSGTSFNNSANITANVTSTLQSVTGRGASTSNALTISNTTNATSYTTGALIIAGGIGVAKDIYCNGYGTFAGGGGTSDPRWKTDVHIHKPDVLRFMNLKDFLLIKDDGSPDNIRRYGFYTTDFLGTQYDSLVFQDNPKKHSLNYSDLHSLAIIELRDETWELKKRVAELEEKVKRLGGSL